MQKKNCISQARIKEEEKFYLLFEKVIEKDFRTDLIVYYVPGDAVFFFRS